MDNVFHLLTARNVTIETEQVMGEFFRTCIFSKPSDLSQSYKKGCIVKVDFIYYGGHCQSKPDQLTQITLDGSTGKKEEAFVNETLDTGLASDSSFSEEETRVDAIISRKRRRSDETMPQRRCFFN